MPLFNGESAEAQPLGLTAVADWLSDSIIDEPEAAGSVFGSFPLTACLCLITRIAASCIVPSQSSCPSCPCCTGLADVRSGSCSLSCSADAMLGSPPKGGRRADLPITGVVQGELHLRLSKLHLLRIRPCLPLHTAPLNVAAMRACLHLSYSGICVIGAQ